MDKRALFLSFSGLARLVKEGGVKEEELDSGLFLFGCTREHLAEKEIPGEMRKLYGLFQGRKCKQDYEIIQRVVKRAEDEGRICFRDARPYTFKQLNEFLRNNRVDVDNASIHGVKGLKEPIIEGFENDITGLKEPIKLKALEKFDEDTKLFRAGIEKPYEDSYLYMQWFKEMIADWYSCVVNVR